VWTGWMGSVYKALKEHGYACRFVQEETTSLPEDVATRARDASQNGPVILWPLDTGGAVLTKRQRAEGCGLVRSPPSRPTRVSRLDADQDPIWRAGSAHCRRWTATCSR